MKKMILTVAALVAVLMTAPALALEVNLIADGGDVTTAFNAGTVDVSSDGTNLTVVYTTIDGWELVETHLGIRTTALDGINVKDKGNVKVGKLSAAGEKTGRDFDPPVTTTTYTFLLADLQVGSDETIDIAAHAAIEWLEILGVPDDSLDRPEDDPNDILHEESAWGEGMEFADDRNWSMYFEFTLLLPDLVVSGVTLDAATVAEGGTLGFSYTVANIGGEGPAGMSTFDVAAYLSTDAVLDGSDTMILGPGGSSGSYSVWTYHLSVGWSSTHSVADGVIDAAPGTYYLIVDADTLPGQPPNFHPGVVEDDETNNWTASAAFTVTAVP